MTDDVSPGVWSLVLAAALFAAGCPNGDADSDADGGPPTDDSTDDGWEPPDGPSWETEFVEKNGWGLHADLATGMNGEVSLAYFSTDGNQGDACTEVGDSPPDRVRWPLHYARRSDGNWSVETVDKPLQVGQPQGLDLEVAPDGTPVVAAMIGEPVPSVGYCGVNDAGLYRRQSSGNWQSTTIVSSSSEVAVDKAGADRGEILGYWPALAYDGSGNAGLVYQDAHFGGRQSDDFKIAALEIAMESGGGWTPKSVDPYRGAGTRNRLVFDRDGRPVVVYILPKESRVTEQAGIWAARSPDGGDSWKRVRLFPRNTSSGPAVAVDPESGRLHVLFYNSERGFPELAVLEQSSKFGSASEGWRYREQDIGNPRYDAGYEPSIAFGPRGRLHAVFYRCTLASGGLGDCKAEEDALVHAWRVGDDWEREVVDTGGEGLCGMSPTLGFDGAGHPVVGYRCEQVVDGEIRRGLKFAVRK